MQRKVLSKAEWVKSAPKGKHIICETLMCAFKKKKAKMKKKGKKWISNSGLTATKNLEGF